MAAYATRPELYQVVSQTALGSLTTAEQDAALESASRKADSYLGVVFELPLTSWGADLKDAVCYLAAYRLMSRRGFLPESGDAELFRDNYKDAIKWLEQVAGGKVKPIDVVDSSSGINNTDAAGAARDPSFVLTPSSDSMSAGGYEEGDIITPGTVETPRRRVW